MAIDIPPAPIKSASQDASAPTCDPDDSAFVDMHCRLVDWGNIYQRGGGSNLSTAGHEVNERAHIQHTGQQLDEARITHALVCALVPPKRFTLMIFYRQDEAVGWWELAAFRREMLIKFMSYDLSKRLHEHMRNTGQWQRSVRPIEFMPLRDEAIRVLIEREALLS
jgi:hypothetical protein